MWFKQMSGAVRSVCVHLNVSIRPHSTEEPKGTIIRAASVCWQADCTERNGNRDHFRSTDVCSISGSIPNV